MTQEPEFQGKIGKTLKDSDPWWPPVPSSHDGNTPNVVVMLFDDTGFGHFGCYGSTIETPHIDKLAAGGLLYTNLHTTALCSPTRASLLTGRNHHAVGMRGIADYDPGFPNMRGAVTRHAATLGEMLLDEGYATFAVGKWHLNPKEERSAAGPFTDWPLQRGFNRYYGFLGGATDQFYPDLTEDNHHINPPKTPEQGYHLNEDLIDHSIDFVRNNKSIYPNQPFFLYLAFGATHSPHQAPQSYIDKYKGKFDHGWDAVRDEWFARQIESGIIPEGTQLAPRNPGVDAWDDLSDGAKKLACKLQEAFAGFLDHTDDQIGRLISIGLEKLTILLFCSWLTTEPAKKEGHRGFLLVKGIRTPILMISTILMKSYPTLEHLEVTRTILGAGLKQGIPLSNGIKAPRMRVV